MTNNSLSLDGETGDFLLLDSFTGDVFLLSEEDIILDGEIISISLQIGMMQDENRVINTLCENSFSIARDVEVNKQIGMTIEFPNVER